MKNAKPIAWGLIASMAVAILNGMSAEAEGIYQLAGLGFFVFGVWAVIVLLRYEN